MMRIPSQRLFPAYVEPDKATPAATDQLQTGHTPKGNSMITAEIPREVTFDLPEGRYAATVSDVRQVLKQSGTKPQQNIRFLFDVTIPGLSEQMDTMAGRTFKLDLNPGSDLRNWLSGLLGSKFFKERAGQYINFDSLIGNDCEVKLEHLYGNGFDRPLVVVAQIFPVNGKEASTRR